MASSSSVWSKLGQSAWEQRHYEEDPEDQDAEDEGEDEDINIFTAEQ